MLTDENKSIFFRVSFLTLVILFSILIGILSPVLSAAISALTR